MPESYVQLPIDSLGKKLRTRQRTIGANTVEEQAVMLGAIDTWIACADAVVPANNKHHIALFNGVGSGKVIKIRKLYCISLQTAAITGAIFRINLQRTVAQSAGTAVAPRTMDSTNAALAAQILCATGATVTDGVLLLPSMVVAEEQPATQALSSAQFLALQNLLIESPELQELTLREGEGFSVKQVTSVTVGSFAWVVVFTVE